MRYILNTKSLGHIYKGFQRLVSLSSRPTQLKEPSTSVTTTIVPRDFSLPNSSWGSEMMRLYEHYNSQCEVETEGGEKQEGPWQRLPSCRDLIKHASGGVSYSDRVQPKGIFFTQNTTEPGAAFEYVVFANNEEQKSVCIFQSGHLLEGAPGHVHGGAIAAMIDNVTGTHATFFYGLVMTANLNINYRSPIPLGSTVVLESSLDKKEGKKTFISCKVTSSDGSQLHTEATVLFLSVSVSDLMRVLESSHL
ncbi:acyl-coenzyme A thioesterase THEM4-like [Centropristis striata]|uniref:acyl-coenzyme A thioesterase THEM4-like n=1 Tax=Centropristis striata TaxID=184440 RepID=UPI0027E0A8F5|nr:acyl-coenzyme A thioesterase THEM4-like [Centropristis striata]